MGTDPFRSLPSSYCGHDALQWFSDFVLWERVLNENPQIERIVELGTGGGAFSLYLHAQAMHRGLDFFTFDHVCHPGPKPPGFTEIDIFESPESVLDLFDRRVALHCDDGDKALELMLFGSELKEGSICIVHDWGTEVFGSDVPENLVPIHEEMWRDPGLSMCGVFRSAR